jgi:hypothetical protein
MQVVIDSATREVSVYGTLLAQPGEGAELVELAESEVAKLAEPGVKTLGLDGVITVGEVPPGPQPVGPSLEERLAAAEVELAALRSKVDAVEAKAAEKAA